MELVRLLYKHKNNDVFNEFPRISDKFLKISDNFPEISEYSLKARTFPNIIRKFPNITEVARDFQGRSEDGFDHTPTN